MTKQLIFIHGGGENGYDADTKLLASLRSELGKKYEIHFPKMPSDESLPDFGWMAKMDNEISMIKDEAIFLIGHCLGASMLLKYLSENQISKHLFGIFLIATPFWKGNEVWKQGLKLQKDFADKIPKDIPVFFYQCEDDEVVPPEHLDFYVQNMPQATIRKVKRGGHQFNNDLSLVAKDIQSV